VGSFAGIALARLGFPFMDPVASLVICLFILKVAVDILKDALERMLDTSCGKEMEQNGNILLRKEMGDSHLEDYFDLCDKCRDSFFGWLNNKPAEQEKPAEKPAKKSAKEGKSNAYTVQQIAEMSGAPVTTVRRHAEGICSTYTKDKQGRTIRRYHLTDDQLVALLERIKSRQQGKRTKI
jgi:hypothetical protein